MSLVAFRLAPGEYDEVFHELNDTIQAAAEDTDGSSVDMVISDSSANSPPVVSFGYSFGSAYIRSHYRSNL
jgi:aspartate oxidase